MFAIKDYNGDEHYVRLDDALHYGNGNTVVQVWDAEGPYATLSTNLPEILPAGMFWLKDWSENKDLAEQLIASGHVVLERDIEPVSSGYVSVYAARLA